MALESEPEMPEDLGHFVTGVVVDIPVHGDYATVVSLADGTVSLYSSTGQGILGTGAVPEVAAAGQQVLIEAQRHLDSFELTDDMTLPPVDTVRLHALTSSGRRTLDIAGECYWGHSPHLLTSVIAACQDLLSQIREHPCS
jgi:hypothetical protein